MFAYLVAAALATTSDAPIDAVARNFQNPPNSARPHTWWHWMDGNVTREGITADLEAMAAVGVGGAHIFDVGQGVPSGPIAYNSPEWRDLMAHAIREAQRLGLDMTMHNCAGWSSSGAPWVRPEDAMKKLVVSLTRVSGPGKPSEPLATPPVTENYYLDVAVLVLRTSERADKPHVAGLIGLGANAGDVTNLEGPVVRADEIVCLSPESIGADGRLNHTLPEGPAWVLRIGATLTGARNVASRASGYGLEVDKLNAAALDRFFEGGMHPLFDRLGSSSALRTVLIDSYETGYQNWSDGLLDEFRKRRGYDATPYLATMAGYVVQDSQTTLGFLYDYRQTIAELWSENYTDHFAKRLSERDIGMAIEPYGNGNFDPFAYSRSAALIMGEYWVGETQLNPSVKHSASIAHVMGMSVVGAEALTAAPHEAGWRNHPRQWKPYADLAMARGINRVIYHRFAHQPWVEGVLPGMTMGPWGSHVDRTSTIWPYMPEWNAYLTRCQYVLQQGSSVADVLLFCGEDVPQSYAGEGQNLPLIPSGYDFDYCGVEPLMKVGVRDGRLVLPSGASYAVLALPNTPRMTVRLARKIRDLARDGAVIVGPRPVRTPSLAEALRGGDRELEAIVKETWGAKESAKGEHRPGKGRVLWGYSVEEALSILGVGPDFTTFDVGLSYTHRKIGDSQVYFVASGLSYPRNVKCEFRLGAGPTSVELWRPESGRIEPAPVWRRVAAGPYGPRIEVSLRMEALESVFVVFRPARSDSPHVEVFEGVARTTSAQELPKLRIIKAEYGDFATKQVRDVTQIVARAATPHGVRLSVTNHALEGDPAVNIVKQLTVTYELGGKVTTVTLRENDTLELGEFPSAITAPDAEVSADGVRVWRNGTYTLRRGDHVRTIEVTDAMEPITLTGEWNVWFPAGWDAPEFATFPKLMSWTDSEEFGIRHFSGTARYQKSFLVPRDAFRFEEVPGSTRWILDLGDVREMCKVSLNGRPLGKMWKPPFRVDVTGVLRAGLNHLEIEVTNLWVNRLIGDEQFPDDIGWAGSRLSDWPAWLRNGTSRPEPRRKTFTTWRHNTKDTPLMPSGLLGPVQIRRIAVHSLW